MTRARPSSPLHRAQYVGLVFSTTECAVAVRSQEGRDAYASVPMEARATWHGWPAHYLEHVPRMLAAALAALQQKGWSFEHPGYLSQAWRQHDLAIIDRDDNLLLPAPSWECNGAVAEVRILTREAPALIRAVGRIEPRFVVAKLPWALRMEPSIRRRIARVMLSGDWTAGMLTGQWRMSTSDALCNGLLDQTTRTLAAAGLRAAKRKLQGRIDPNWFPETIPSSDVVGSVRLRRDRGWDAVTGTLKNWKVVASLGDNQATAAGSGAADHGTIVLSLGTSGTVNRVCAREDALRGRALSFEYWGDRLLLMMLPGCGAWYTRYRHALEPGYGLHELNEAAAEADFKSVRRVRPPTPSGELRDLQTLRNMPRAERVASVQLSIALELLERCRTMLREVRNQHAPVQRFVLTGGLARAPLVRRAIAHGLANFAPGALVLLNSHTGPLAYKSDALGAIYNAAMAHTGLGLRELIDRDSHPRACDRQRGAAKARLDTFVSGAIHPRIAG